MTLMLGQTGVGFPLASAVTAHLSASGNQLKVGCPFVSLAGLDLFVRPLASVPAWKAADKRWIVGVHHGITEPAALRSLLAADNSAVRLFVGGTSLKKQSLRAMPIFHAKVVGIENAGKATAQLEAVVVSSANLTRAALGGTKSPANFEAGMSSSAVTAFERKAWSNWWANAWNVSLPLTEALLGRYQDLREEFLAENKVVVDALDPPSISLVTSAPSLWIEAGAMSGGSRNQVEFNRELAEFFGPPAAKTRLMQMSVGGRTWADRSLSYKETTFGVEIWRLSLPTSHQGGFDYPGKIIRIERRDKRYAVDVAEPGSPKARLWRREASSFGHLGVTSGQREFGLV